MALGEAYVSIQTDLAPLMKSLVVAEKQTRATTTNIQNNFNQINMVNINNNFQTYNNNLKKSTKETVIATTTMSDAIRNVYYAWRTARFAIMAIGEAIKWLFNPMVQFEDQLATVATMLDKHTMFHMKNFSIGLRQLSKDFGLSTADLSISLKEILSSSFAPSKALSILEVGAKSAIAGMSTTQKAAEVLTGILNSYGLGAKKAMEISDAMFMTIKRGRITFEQMSETIGQVASGAASAGISFDELSAAISVLTRKGVPYSRTMTSLNALVRAFLKNTKESREVAAGFGLELSTNTLKTIGLAGVLKKLNSATDEQLAKVFPNIRSMRAIIGLVRDRTKFTEELAFWNKAAGKTEEALSKKMDTTSRKIKIFNQHINDLKLSLEGLLPLLNDQVVAMTRLAKATGEGNFLEAVATNFEVASNRLGASIKILGVYFDTGFEWAYDRVKYYLDKMIQFMKKWAKRAIIALSPKGLLDAASEKLGMFGGQFFKMLSNTVDGFKEDLKKTPNEIEIPLELGLLLDLNQVKIAKIWEDYDKILEKIQKKKEPTGLKILDFDEKSMDILFGEKDLKILDFDEKSMDILFGEKDLEIKLDTKKYRTEWESAVAITIEKFSTMEGLFVEFNSTVTSNWANTIEEFITGSGDMFERIGSMFKNFIQTVADALNQLMAKKAAQWFFGLMFDQGGMFAEFGNLFGGNAKTSITENIIGPKNKPLASIRQPIAEYNTPRTSMKSGANQMPSGINVKIENQGTPQEVSSSNFDMESMVLNVVTKNLITNPSFAGMVRG